MLGEVAEAPDVQLKDIAKGVGLIAIAFAAAAFMRISIGCDMGSAVHLWLVACFLGGFSVAVLIVCEIGASRARRSLPGFEYVGTRLGDREKAEVTNDGNQS